MSNKPAAHAAKKAGALEPVTGNSVALVKAEGIQESLRQLNDAEVKQLAKCEAVIKKGITAFKEVAEALLEINEKELYKAEYTTFQEYCRSKWDITARHANRLMLAGEVVKNLESDQLVSSKPVAIPENEAQARPLEGLPREQQVKAARIVAKKTQKPTAKDFEDAAEEVTGGKIVEKKQELNIEEEETKVKSSDIRETKSAIIPESKVEIDPHLVPMAQIIETLKQISYIYNNSGKKQEGLKLIDKVEHWLGDWAEWEAQQKEVV